MTTRDRVLLFLLFGGFLVFGLEVRYEHRDVFAEKWQTWIPLYYSGLAALACLIGMASKKVPRTIAAVIFFGGFIVSGVGLFFHTEGFSAKYFQKFLMPDSKVMTGTGEDAYSFTLPQPLAAPLGLAGLASIGFVVTSGLFRPGKSK